MAQIVEVSEIMGLPKQDIIRLAAEIGLEHLRRIDYSLAKAVVDAAEAKKATDQKDNHQPKTA